jgi:hypothetical protein
LLGISYADITSHLVPNDVCPKLSALRVKKILKKMFLKLNSFKLPTFNLDEQTSLIFERAFGHVLGIHFFDFYGIYSASVLHQYTSQYFISIK